MNLKPNNRQCEVGSIIIYSFYELETEIKYA